MSLSRNVTGWEFQRHGPATEKLLSPRRVRVLLVAHVKTSADRSDRRPMSVKSWQSSARYCGSWVDSRHYRMTSAQSGGPDVVVSWVSDGWFDFGCERGREGCSLSRGGGWNSILVHFYVFTFNWLWRGGVNTEVGANTRSGGSAHSPLRPSL